MNPQLGAKRSQTALFRELLKSIITIKSWKCFRSKHSLNHFLASGCVEFPACVFAKKRRRKRQAARSERYRLVLANHEETLKRHKRQFYSADQAGVCFPILLFLFSFSFKPMFSIKFRKFLRKRGKRGNAEKAAADRIESLCDK